MASAPSDLTDELMGYVHRTLPEHPALVAAARTDRADAQASMQIGAEQGAFMALLGQAVGARRILEVGTFTGYSSTVDGAGPAAGRPDHVPATSAEEWTAIAREAWADAGVADRVELRLAPAAETLATLEGGTYDLAFIDADKWATTRTTPSACASSGPAA